MRRLLVIEDGDEYAEFARLFLGPDFQVRQASSAAEALHILATETHDVQPGRHGLGLCVRDPAERALRVPHPAAARRHTRTDLSKTAGTGSGGASGGRSFPSPLARPSSAPS